MQEGKQFISPIKQRVLSFATTLGISKREFYVNIGVSRGTLESKTGITEDILAKFIATYPDVSPLWLLTGEGSMLRHSKNPEETTIGDVPNVVPISPAEESIIYKMYKDEKEENKALIEEIGGLKERIRQLESQDKEPEHHSSMDKVTETFTSDLSGDYGEGFLPTKQPTISKRSLAGKI